MCVFYLCVNYRVNEGEILKMTMRKQSGLTKHIIFYPVRPISIAHHEMHWWCMTATTAFPTDPSQQDGWFRGTLGQRGSRRAAGGAQAMPQHPQHPQPCWIPAQSQPGTVRWAESKTEGEFREPLGMLQNVWIKTSAERGQKGKAGLDLAAL